MFKSASLSAVVVLLVITCVAVSAQLMDQSKTAPVATAVEALRVAMVSGNEKEMNALVDDHLTYGHSHGLLQDKTAFVKNLVGPNAPGKFNWIKLSKQTIDMVGKVALVRHVFDAENVLPDGKITKAHILVLQVWMQEKGGWKLLARQACPLD
jgi:hypothetical protein